MRLGNNTHDEEMRRAPKFMKNLIKRLLLAFAICSGAGVSSIAQDRQTPDAARTSTKADPVVIVHQDKQLEKYSPPDGAFSILLPGKPEVAEEGVDTAVGKLINHTFSAEGTRVSYAVMYGELPAPVSDPEVIKGMLDNARISGLAAVHGELQSETEITINGYLGREWLVKIPSGLFLQARAYQVKNRLYQVIAMKLPEQNPEILKSREIEVKRFFDSFALASEATK